MDKLSTRKGAISDIEIIVQFQKNMALETEERILLESSIRSGVTEVIGDEQKGTYLVAEHEGKIIGSLLICLLYTSPSPRDLSTSRMPSSA